MPDIIKHHMKAIAAAAVIIALMVVVLTLLTADGVVANAFKNFISSAIAKATTDGGF